MSEHHLLALRFDPDVGGGWGWGEGDCQHSNSKSLLGTQLLPGASVTAQPQTRTGIASLTKVSGRPVVMGQSPALGAQSRLPCEQTVCCWFHLAPASLCLQAGDLCSPGL